MVSDAKVGQEEEHENELHRLCEESPLLVRLEDDRLDLGPADVSVPILVKHLICKRKTKRIVSGPSTTPF